VRIHPDTGTAEVIVPDFQLSLAIGKEGQNARLAARLSGWRVDIKSETQLMEEESGAVEYAEGEWVENEAGELVWQPAEGGEAISAAEAGYAGAKPDGEGTDGEGGVADEATVEAELGVAPVKPDVEAEESGYADVTDEEAGQPGGEEQDPEAPEEAAMHIEPEA